MQTNKNPAYPWANSVLQVLAEEEILSFSFSYYLPMEVCLS